MNNSSTNNTPTDEQLMQQVARGDNSAFDTLYNRHSRRLCGFFTRMLGCDIEEAKDLTHDLFTRIYAKRHKYKIENFGTWLYGAAYNICKNEFRHRQIQERFSQEQMEQEEPATEQPQTIDSEQINKMLHKAIDSLPTAQREVFILRYIEELSTTEVAQIVDCPEGTVKSRLHHALESIREKMKKYKI